MNAYAEWQENAFTLELIRWLEKKRQEAIRAALDSAGTGNVAATAICAGKEFSISSILAKIREKRSSDESV